MNHIMMDIETFGTDSNSVILSISAVEFDLVTGEVGKTFEVAMDVQEQLRYGRIIEPDTVAWWMGQSKEAINATFRLNRISVVKALNDFNQWIKDLGVPAKDIKLWGNGVGFDCILTRNLYKAAGVEFILPYWCDNDVRTLVTLGGIDTRNFEFVGTKHYGIDDCKHQIKYCCTAYKGL
jgi:hypothetical protein